MGSVRRAFAFIVILTAVSVAFAATDEVKIDGGRLKGVTRDGVAIFKGIPFAAPPVGDLRWRPPQPVKAWTGVRLAEAFGPDCMQQPFPGDMSPLAGTPSEGCLYVNVWAPAGGGAKLPVMVWMYGGALVNGGSSPAVYDGSQFAKQGVVFVSFNYRLGRFGFFGFPALTREFPDELKGNYGYMDQIAALKWVQRNAGAFGGDADNVTIFGESSGGGSVIVLLSSPLAKGLFHKAIVESGGGRKIFLGRRYLNKTGDNGVPSAEQMGVNFAKSAGVEGQDAAALAALRKLPADVVLGGVNDASIHQGVGAGTYCSALVDGKIVVESQAEAYAAGRGAKVPLMAGTTNADSAHANPSSKEEVFKQFGALAEQARAVYDPDGKIELKALSRAVEADLMMVEPARFLAQSITAAGEPAYIFRFSYIAESKRKVWSSAPHATEIPFVFDNPGIHYGKDLTEADKAVARAANSYWVNFAKTGNPNGKGLPEWPVYSPQTDKLMNFTNAGPVGEADPWKARLDLVEALAK